MKECTETKYWIELLRATDYINQEQKDSIIKDCIELEKILSQTKEYNIENLQDIIGRAK